MSLQRTLRLVAALMLLVATVLPSGTAAVAQTSDERFFSQTGFRVDNVAFWDFFQRRGGVRTFGYPVSREFQMLGFPVQIFQRIVMQQNPDGSVATLNLLDEGLMPYTRINGSTFPAPDPSITSATPSPSDPDYAEKMDLFIQQQAPDTFQGEPVQFGTTFRTTVTYEDAFPDGGAPESLVPGLNLELWGAPTSRPTVDPANTNFIYQRFQRGIMHYDKSCGCTQGLLLADYLKSIVIGQDVPPDLADQARTSRFYRQYAPGRPASLARPADLPATDLTNAFEPQAPGYASPQPAPLFTTGGSPAPVPPPSPPPVPGSFTYGFQVHLWQFSPEAKSTVMGLVEQAKFGSAKHQVEWSAIEKAPGQYDFSDLDQIVDAATAKNVKMLLSITHAPTFRRGPGTGYMPANTEDFRQFMQVLASRYAGRVQAYELWNEENLDRETGPGNVNPANYLPLLKAGFGGVKAGDPGALVVLGALSPTGANVPGSIMDDLTYLEQLFALNGGEVRQYFDVLGAHPSGFSNPPDCTSATPQCSLSGGFNNHDSFFAFDRVRQYYGVMQRNDAGQKKIWFTEYGYGSTDQPVPGYEYAGYISEQQQADFLVRAFQKAREYPYIGGIFVWNLNFQIAVPKSDEKWAFGVLRPDYSGRPAYYALRDMPKQ